MSKTPSDIRERTFEFAVRIVKLCQELDKRPGVSRNLNPATTERRNLSWRKHRRGPRRLRAERISSVRIQ